MLILSIICHDAHATYDPAAAHQLDELSDVGSSTATDGNILIGNNAEDFDSRPVTGDIGIDGTGATTIQADAVTLATDTTGNFVASVFAGAGITTTGAGGENISHTLSIELKAASQDGAGTTGSPSGLEFIAGELTLVQGCSNSEILKWDEATDRWQCASDVSGGGGDLDNLSDVGVSTATNGSVLAAFGGSFNATTTPTWEGTHLFNAATALNVDDNTIAGTTAVIDFTDFDVAADGQITIASDTNVDGITFDVGTMTDAIDASDADIVNAINIGANNIVTSATVIDSTELDVLNGGIGLDELNDVGSSTATDGNILIANNAGDFDARALSGDVDIDGTGATTIQADAVALGTDTTGNYVASVFAGAGVTTTGAGGEGVSHTLSIELKTASQDGAGTTGSPSGMEFLAGDLTLIQGCSDNEILKWDEATDRWQCQADDTGSGVSALSDLSDVGVSTATNGSVLAAFGGQFNATTTPTWTGTHLFTAATAINIDDNSIAGTTASISFTDFSVSSDGLIQTDPDGGGTGLTIAPSAALVTGIDVSDADIGTAISIGENLILGTDFVVTGDGLISITPDDGGDGLTIAPSAALTDGIDVSDADITNAINVGANTITGTTPTIDFTDFDVDSDGKITLDPDDNGDAITITTDDGDAVQAIVYSSTQTVETSGLIDFDIDAGNAAVDVINLDLDVDNVVTGGTDIEGIVLQVSTDDADADVFGMRMTFEDTANATVGSFVAGLLIDNQETTISSMQDGIQITASGASGITDGLDVSDAGIVNAVNVGDNIITGSTAVILFTDFVLSSDGLISTTPDGGGDGITIAPSAALTDGIDVSDADITNAINVGANTITGTTPTIDFTDFDVDSDGKVSITPDSDGDAITVITGNSTDGQVLVGIGQATTNTDGLIDLTATSSADGFEMINIDLTDLADTDSDEITGILINMDQNDTSTPDVFTGLWIENENGVEPADRLIYLNNADTASDTVNDGILIESEASGITDAIDASDAQITNAINIGSNNILTGAATIASTELDLLDGMTGKTGSDTTFATGTAGGSGECVQWDANGDLITTGSACGTATSLDGLSDVGVSTATNGSVLAAFGGQFNATTTPDWSGTHTFSASTAIDVLDNTITGSTAVIDFTDFDVSADGQITIASDTNVDGITFNVGTMTDAIDASDSSITNALNVGPNTITGTTYTLEGTTAVIDFTDFDVSSDGQITISSDTNVDGITFSVGTMTDAIDASDSSIVNAINIGANNILTSGATIASTELDLLDGMTGKTGSDTTFATGTAGGAGECAQWDANGDLVTSGGSCGGAGASALNELSDVGVSTATNGSVLAAFGGSFNATTTPDWSGTHTFSASTALDVLDNTITGSTAVINFTDFDVAADGQITISSDTNVDGITFNVGTMTDAIDASDSSIVNAINVGNNIILGTAAGINFTSFDVDSSGQVDITPPNAVIDAITVTQTSDDVDQQVLVYDGTGARSGATTGLIDLDVLLRVTNPFVGIDIDTQVVANSAVNETLSLINLNYDLDSTEGENSTLIRGTYEDGVGVHTLSSFMDLQHLDTNDTLTDGIIIAAATGGITDAIDVSDAEITNAINVGANIITGSTATINFTDFDVSSDGNVTIANDSGTSIDINMPSSGEAIDIAVSSPTATTGSFMDVSATNVSTNGWEGFNITVDTGTSLAGEEIIGFYLGIDNDDSTPSTENVVAMKLEGIAGSSGIDSILWLNQADTTASDTVDDGVLITAEAGGITDAIDASDSEITNALNVGDNIILGTTATIDFDDFDVDSDGFMTFASDAAGDQITITPVAGDYQALVYSGTAVDNTGSSGVIDLDIQGDNTGSPGLAGIHIDVDAETDGAAGDVFAGIQVNLDTNSTDLVEVMYGMQVTIEDTAGETGGTDMIRLLMADTDDNASSAIEVAVAAGGGFDTAALDLEDADIGTAIALDDNEIAGDLATIDFTNFDVNADGNIFGVFDGTATGNDICRSGTSGRVELVPCTSTIKIKKDVEDLDIGLDTVTKLRPVSFVWKDSLRKDVGFIAEEVREVEPLLTTTYIDEEGEETPTVAYRHYTAVLTKAIQELNDEMNLIKLDKGSEEYDEAGSLLMFDHENYTVSVDKGSLGVNISEPETALHVTDHVSGEGSYVMTVDNTAADNDKGLLLLSYANDSEISNQDEWITYRDADGIVGDVDAEVTYNNFTGVHLAYSEEDISEWKYGMIVETTGQIHATSRKSLVFTMIKLSTDAVSKKVMGVFAGVKESEGWLFAKPSEGELGKSQPFIRVNAIGDGVIWVTNINGDVQNGDYVTSSKIAGYGMKQDDDILRSSTVAKVTEEVDWDKVTDYIEFEGKRYKRVLVTCVYKSG